MRCVIIHRSIFKGFTMIIILFIFSGSRAQAEEQAVLRIWGSDRYATAAAVSRSGWDTSDCVILVRGDDFPDALCACPLAKKYDAPILLTEHGRLSHEALEEIKRLRAKHVIIIGGTGAVSAAVEEELTDEGIDLIERIYGRDRFETSARIAERLGEVDTIAVVTGGDFPDALSISAIAAVLKIPILLVERDGIPGDVESYIAGRDVVRTYVIGGTAVISNEVADILPNPHRIYGDDRYDTNIEVIKMFQKELDFFNIYAAVGEEYADALTGAALAARDNAPVVLVHDILPEQSSEFLEDPELFIISVTVIGGVQIIPAKVLDSLAVYINSASDAFNPEEDDGHTDDGANQIHLSGMEKSHTCKQGERSVVTFEASLAAGLKSVDGVTYIMEWKRNGSTALSNDITIFYDNKALVLRSGRYEVGNTHTVSKNEVSTLEIIFNSEGLYELTIYAQIQNGR